MFLSLIAIKKCYHDVFQSKITNLTNIEVGPQTQAIGKKEINIHFDLSSVMSNSDNQMCEHEDQVVRWSLANDMYICTSKDIITEEQKLALQQTFNEVKSLVNSFLLVEPLNQPISPAKILDFPINESLLVDTDLFISVYVRKLQHVYDTNMGSVFQVLYKGRPVQGVIFIDPQAIPSKYQSLNMPNREFFLEILHQVFHILGISKNLVNYWIDNATNTQYKQSPIQKLHYNKYNKDYFVVDTPSTRKFMDNRFGNKPIENINGIELDLTGNDYTSHTSGIVYFSDIMNTVSMPSKVISDATKSILMSTGFYQLSDSKFNFEKINWGNGTTVGKKKRLDFPFESPQKTYPANYFCKNDQKGEICSYDYKGRSECAGDTTPSCYHSSLADYCSEINYSNPNNLNLISFYKEFEYQNVKIPKGQLCSNSESKTDKSISRKEEFGENSFCAEGNDGTSFAGCYKMFCDEYGTLFIKIGRVPRICYSGKKIKFGNTEILCPPSESICSISPVDNRYSKLLILVAIYMIFLLTIIVSMIILCLYCRHLKTTDGDTPADRTVDIPLVISI
ncbi:GP63-like [Trichomonas vaginalis G3]|uniref:GP63-like n=1 Tax=Trichomonas vaginalis (strain ATCC PRA-98 / G3) TaxID=412133 RepID=A2EJ58_TRIV3|nr:regulation of choline O-acetyltransferase protein [Trichomonas vaginalis G3]EAY07290.1 GP63-like [Trichomonas vaginalis G3]KAI5550463.1 regulation of choline O-acetyltransferase protein [Trichomonas vaginalis G3]|eukprot:XP_001319513.1 GP63-like [Trichomonas vaginalis G3]